MIPAQRRAKILDLVRRQGGASIDHLAGHLCASTSTVPRDLNLLTKQGYLERSHGGATVRTLPPTTFEPDREIGADIARDAKVVIGARAAALIESGQSVIFDSSSTVLEAAKWVVERELRITALTNDLKIAIELAAAPGIKLIVVGGALRAGSFTLTGNPGQEFLHGIHADLALVGIHSLARQRLSETSIEVAQMKRLMIDAARRAIVLADSSKFEGPAFAKVCDVARVDRIITDDEAADDDLADLGRLGVQVDRARIGRAA